MLDASARKCCRSWILLLGVSVEIRELDSLAFDAEKVDLRAVTGGWALVFCFTRRGAGSRRSSPPPGEIRLLLRVFWLEAFDLSLRSELRPSLYSEVEKENLKKFGAVQQAGWSDSQSLGRAALLTSWTWIAHRKFSALRNKLCPYVFTRYQFCINMY